MEEAGMMTRLKGLFRFRDVWFLLSLTAVGCLPLALIKILRDADLSLLLPITLLGMILAWWLGTSKVRKLSAGVVLLGLGPLTLVISIGGMWSSLAGFIKSAIVFAITLFKLFFFHSLVEFSPMLFAREELLQKVLGFGYRFASWTLGFVQGDQIEDPLVRTLIWCLVLWLLAAWAGWQMPRRNRLLAGVFPTTLLLAFIIDYSGEEIEILLLHLGLLLFLLGLTSFSEQKKHWELSKTDYSESTSLDTLGTAAALTVVVMAFSSLASTTSVQEIIEKLREKQERTTETQGETLGLEPVKDNANIVGIENGLPRSHLIESGPELSRQLVMTISTGELPPMPEAAHVPVPRHYWRTLTYQDYTGLGWFNPSAFGVDVAADEKLIPEVPPSYRLLTQSVTFSDETNDRLYWSGTLLSADVPFQAAWLRKAPSSPLLHSNLMAALASTKSYRAESLELNVTAATLRKSPSVYPDWVKYQYLGLPELVPARVYSLARDLTAAEPTPYDRALAIENYLRTFPYTLEVDQPPPGRDVADYFLFDLKQGYCDYYATTMAVLARATGLPARLVIGYANGAYDYQRAEYIVTENYAHSWVEIYFTDIGWVEFEPTAAQPAILYEETNELVTPMAENVPMEGPSTGQLPHFLQTIFAKAWFPVLLIFVCGLLWIGFDSFRLSQLDPSRTIQLLYGRLRRLAQPVTGHAPRNQTAYSYALNLVQCLAVFETSPRLQTWLVPAHQEIEKLTELFSRSLFAPQQPTHADAKNALRSWSRLRWRLILANVLRIVNKKATLKA
jgi:transglutaminase-like putative cysteine protease